MRILAAMMERNEEILLEPWIRYHGHLFGFENLIVFDHGSENPGIDATLTKYRDAGVDVRRLPKNFDFKDKGEAISSALQDADATGLYDFLFPIDCDEFLVLHDRTQKPTCSREAILAYLESLQGETRLIEIRQNLLNVLDRPGWFWDFDYQKVFFARGCCGWVNHGYHAGYSARSPDRTVSKLSYAHYHHKPYQLQKRASLEKLKPYVDVSDLQALAAYRGEGWHLLENLLLTEDQYNLKFAPSINHIAFPQILDLFGALGINRSLPDAPPAGCDAQKPFVPLRPVVHVEKQGNLANQMIQMMAALTVAEHIGGAVLSNIDIPEYNIVIQEDPSNKAGFFPIEWQAIEFPRLIKSLSVQQLSSVIIRGYCQRMENFLPKARYAEIFRPRITIEGYGAEYLVCNIHGAEILSGAWPNYTLVPIEFYQAIVTETGLTPVFMGQIEDNPYVRDLRTAFPGALFIPSQGVLQDFETVRRSRNIAISVSTFSWLAAWLSDAERVFLPMTGFLNPFQEPDVDLLPLDDPRYRFYWFPINFAQPVAEYEKAHAPIRGMGKLVSAAEIRKMLADAQRRKELTDTERLALFDEAGYLAANPDVHAAVRQGAFTAGRNHFEIHGLAEGRPPTLFDRGWYSRAYPDAAGAVGRGEFRDFFDHFVFAGRHLGYRSAANS